MRPDDIDAVEQIFWQALELPSDERERFLDEQCDGDEALVADICSLLAAHERAGDFLSEPASRHADDGVGSELDCGGSIGPYELLRQLGEGETSTVYLAVRADEQYRKLVAIKLLKRGMDTDSILQRFQRERQILAALEHPNIAGLLDGGSTPDGRPYFVMEYVVGDRIDRYCDRHGLGVRERIELFRTVCAAVQHAHGELVVHRDIKPGNILITPHGEPRLLDFGIAKLLDPDGPLEQTATAARLMTPRYASPEQVLGRTVSTATDVYSLGVLLYELLSGRRPYEIEGRSFTDVEKAICDSRPEPPSVAVGNDDQSTPADQAAGGRRRLARRLTGDLDTIVMKAIRKEPQRRYGSVQELADDLRRHLARLPISARKDTIGYRTGRFLRRNAIAVAATVVVTVGLLTGLVVALWQAEVARRAQTHAEAEQLRAQQQQERAESEQQRAERVSDFLIDIFEVSDPGEAKGNTVTAREILDRGSEQIARELADQPDVQATMMDTMGKVYFKLGLYDQAQRLIEQGLEIRRQTFGDDCVEVAASLANHGDVLRKLGRHTEAMETYRRALEIQRGSLNATDPALLNTIVNIGLTLIDQAEYQAAESLFVEALELQSRRDDALPGERASTLNNLGLALERQGRYAEAEQLLREAVELAIDSVGENHPSVGVYLNNLANALRWQAKTGEAEETQRRALAVRRSVLGDDHFDVATSLNNLAALLSAQNRHVEAEEMLREAQLVLQRAVGEDHPRIALGLNNLANNLADQNRHAEAEAMLQDAVELSRRLLGDGHPQVMLCTLSLAGEIDAQLRYAEAEPLYRRALAGFQEVYGGDHPHIAIALNNLAGVLYRSEKYDESVLFYTRSLAMFGEIFDPGHPNLSICHKNIAKALVRLGRDDEAESAFRQALEIADARPESDHLRVQPLQGLGEVLTERGDTESAEPLLREAVAIRRRALPDEEWLFADARGALGACLTAQRRFDEAEELLLDSLSTLDSAQDLNPVWTELALRRVVDLYQAWGRPEPAERYAARLESTGDRMPGPGKAPTS